MGAPIGTRARDEAAAEVTRQLQVGAREALARLFDENRGRLLALAERMVSAAEAEDVVQDAFVSTLRHHQQFRGQASPSTWLYRVTFNAALMRLRTRRRKGAESLDALPHEVAEASIARHAPPASNPALDAELAEARRALDDAVGQLRPVDQRIVRLRFIEGMSTEEVATATGLSIAATKTRLHRARAALRALLDGDARMPMMA
jgi:RNA polymerase sigma-70 factor, ECF subfamily